MVVGSAGATAVWAEENTREAIFDAMQRRETYGTSGPLIRLRFFGGWDYDEDLTSDDDFVEEAYAGGFFDRFLMGIGALALISFSSAACASGSSLTQSPLVRSWIMSLTTRYRNPINASAPIPIRNRSKNPPSCLLTKNSEFVLVVVGRALYQPCVDSYGEQPFGLRDLPCHRDCFDLDSVSLLLH